MPNDEFERAFEFIVKQQAQGGADMQKLAEAQVRTDSRMAELAQAQKRTDEARAETSDRLNSLIVVVERYFSNGRLFS